VSDDICLPLKLGIEREEEIPLKLGIEQEEESSLI